MEQLLDLASPPTPQFISLLDETLRVMYDPNNPARGQAQQVLVKLQEHPNAWTRVAYILTNTQSPNSKFYALQVLNNTIKTRWKALPANERKGIRDYIVQQIVSLTKDDASLQAQRQLIRKMNETLVNILKLEWPHNWPSFIDELVASAKSSESICENNVHILKLLSEEIFVFSKDSLTSKKSRQLKEQLNSEFAKIFELCEVILQRSQRPSLLTVTLQTLLRFLSWVPLGYIFETKLIETLLVKFFPVPTFRNDTLACLTEIGSLSDLPGDRYNAMLKNLFLYFMKQLVTMLPPETDVASAFKRGTEEDQRLVQGLALFLTSLFKQHLELVEGPDCKAALLQSLQYLVQISAVDDMEIFKICVEFWNSLSRDVYTASTRASVDGEAKSSNGVLQLGNGEGKTRAEMYSPVFTRVRLVFIIKMAKPEEVLIDEDERGEIVRQATRDTDAIALYKTMKETLVYLTHLDYEDTEILMLDKLSRQVSGEEWSWNNLNRLCWAIGSISLTMNEENEKRFLVTVIKDLLGLCEAKRGKDNKAVIASNIMYVVGQYPRFLKAHWRFLKTVVNKLFEFMHELHPGVQDMACDTFLKISKKCRKKFVECQLQERMPYIQELLNNLPSIISSLETHQMHVFYEAVGFMVAAVKNPERRKALLLQTMELPNRHWKTIMEEAGRNVESLKSPEQIKAISKILRTNISVCRSLGQPFIDQIGTFYRDMLNVYRVYSQHVQQAVQQGGQMATKTTQIRLMRAAKKETLQLIECFISKANQKNAAMVSSHFLPPMLDSVLGDYHGSIAEARDPEVLSLLTTMVTRLQGEIQKSVPTIMQAVFEVTLNMLTANFTDFPEIRKNFFALLKAIVTKAFPAIFTCPPEYQRAVIDAIVGAFKHTERIVADIGLEILQRFLHNVRGYDGIAQGFYKQYLLSLVQEVFSVLTDRMHKPGFVKQCNLLQYMLHLVESGSVTAQLYDPANATHMQVCNVAPGAPPPANPLFIKQYTAKMIASMFPNLSSTHAEQFVIGMCDMQMDLTALKTHVRDFLIKSKQWGDDDDDSLEREAVRTQKELAAAANQQHMQSVPGMVKPSELPDDMDDL